MTHVRLLTAKPPLPAFSSTCGELASSLEPFRVRDMGQMSQLAR